MSTERQFDGKRRGRGRRSSFGLRPTERDPGTPGFDPQPADREPRMGGFDPRLANFDPRTGGRGRGGRGRAGRGDVRAAILLLLAEQPMHGYQIIHELSDRTGGIWHPSPGAVYPALSMLEDEGLIIITNDSGRKLATLTDAGQAYIEREKDHMWVPWLSDRFQAAAANRVLAEELRSLSQAARQAMHAGGDDIARRVAETIANARRAIFAILAEPPKPTTPTATDNETD